MQNFKSAPDSSGSSTGTGLKRAFTVGLIGNPNCGKTTIFNNLTGARQHIGNWPGVTVEKKTGRFHLPGGSDVNLVDLPGIYSLMATSDDERASLEYLLSHEADIFINVIDATALERSLYLTLLLCEMKLPIVVVLTMTDIAKQRNIEIDMTHLSEHLGVPVIGMNATRGQDMKSLLDLVERVRTAPQFPSVQVTYPNEVEREIDILSSATIKTAQAYASDGRWIALKALEGDPLITKALVDFHDMAPEVADSSIARIENVLKQTPDVVLAETRYGVITGLCRDVLKIAPENAPFSEKIDKVIINRVLGIPIFLGIMFAIFWLTQSLGGAFIDFFDLLGGAVFVDGLRHVISSFLPDWLTALLADGLGSAIRTMASFVPPIFFMFLCLAILEDSGYMARAAFVMDRFMRWIGLPGKSFVPLLVGFGCTVPAIMATRTLESKRDKFLTIFMTPFMSCGAKLPVYTVFGAAFFADNPGKLLFLLYISGIALGILTGIVMKNTLFRGEPSHFIMELPPYHIPRPKHILIHTWERLREFIFRAGKVIIPMVIVLGFLNTMGYDGTLGNENTEKSILATVGKTITPVFEPMGVEKDNWPAALAIFTGLFAKESVIGTLKGLYGQSDKIADGDLKISAQIREAFESVPKNLKALVSSDECGEEVSETRTDANMLTRHFRHGPNQCFAYLLFILLYVPCIAATGVAFRELGGFYGTIFASYLTILGWTSATLYFQITIGRNPVWIVTPLAILATLFAFFRIVGKRELKKLNQQHYVK